MTKDIHLYEDGTGSNILVSNNDILLSETLYQTIYIALFGGNKEAVTTGEELENQERKDYWANSLIYGDNPDKQFNSVTERTLSEVTLNSSGRLTIIRAVESDLDFLKKTAKFNVKVVILSVNSVKIQIFLESSTKQDNNIFDFVWNNAKNEVIIDRTI